MDKSMIVLIGLVTLFLVFWPIGLVALIIVLIPRG